MGVRYMAHGHGAWARHTNRTAQGQWRRHSGFRLSLSVSHRRSQFLCGLSLPLSSADGSRLAAHVSHLTALDSRFTTPGAQELADAVARARSRRPRRHPVRALLRARTLPGPLALFPSPASSHHQSRIPSSVLERARNAVAAICLTPPCHD